MRVWVFVRSSSAAGVCIDLAVHPNAVIENGEDFAASGDKLGDESPTDSGSSTSPSDNMSEDSAPSLEMNALLHTTHSAAQLLNEPVAPP